MQARAVLIWMFMLASAANAQDHPTTGLVHNQTEANSLQYDCQIASATRLDCDFRQASVRKKARPDELEREIQAAKAEAASGRRLDAESCKMFATMKEIFDGKAAAPKPEALAAMTSIQKRDAIQAAATMLAVCAAPTEATYVAAARMQFEKDSRTCRVWSNGFRQTFKPIASTKGRTWVVDSTATGDCGVVRLDRFELDTQSLTSSKVMLWNYVAKKAITNPDGTLAGSLACSKLDVAEYRYLWKSDERQMSCDYIEFAP